MAKASIKSVPASSPQSTQKISEVDCGGIAGRSVVKQLDLLSTPTAVRREERASAFRAVCKSIVYKDVPDEPNRWFAGQLGIDESTTSRKLSGRGSYDIGGDEIAVILEMPSAIVLGNWIAAQLGQKPLEPLRVVTEEEVAAAYRAEAREAGALGEAMTARIAARLGVDVASVKR